MQVSALKYVKPTQERALTGESKPNRVSYWSDFWQQQLPNESLLDPSTFLSDWKIRLETYFIVGLLTDNLLSKAVTLLETNYLVRGKLN